MRHGQSEWNVRRVTQGQIAYPRLTAAGREQARAAAQTIAEDLGVLARQPGRIVTSDLARAVETAEILAARLGGTIELDRRLREQHLGWLEGRGYAETWDVTAQHDWSDPTLPIAGGESLDDVYARMAAALASVDRATVNILISHGDAIQTTVAHLKRWRRTKRHGSTYPAVRSRASTTKRSPGYRPAREL